MNKPIVVKVQLAWWFRYLYQPLLALTYSLAKKINPFVELNQTKLNYWIEKALSIK